MRMKGIRNWWFVILLKGWWSTEGEKKNLVLGAVSSLPPSWGLLLFCFYGACKSALMLLRHYYTGCQKDMQSTAPTLEVWSSRQKYFCGMDHVGTSCHLTAAAWLALPSWLDTLLCGEKDGCCTAPPSINVTAESSPPKLPLVKVISSRMQLHHLSWISVRLLTLSPIRCSQRCYTGWKNQWGGLKTHWVQMGMIGGMKPRWRPVTNVP